MNAFERLVETVRTARVIIKGKKNYKYIILPFDYKAEPDEIDIICKKMLELVTSTVNMDDVNKIVTIEAKGMLIGAPLSVALNKPLYIIRKRKYDLEGEREVVKKTGYGESKIYINGLEKGDRIIIVDDLISTGGTLKSVLNALNEMGCEVKGLFTIFDKKLLGGSDAIEKMFGIPVYSLIKFTITEDNRVIIL